MIVLKTAEFAIWMRDLRDRRAQKRIAARLLRLEHGLFGDAKSVGDGVNELRFDFGPGYRVYFQQRGRVIVLLLCGGDKGSQIRDIERAKQIASSTTLPDDLNRRSALDEY
jgi:putative addiction module killer protein